jgi:hypothetical protein
VSFDRDHELIEAKPRTSELSVLMRALIDNWTKELLISVLTECGEVRSVVVVERRIRTGRSMLYEIQFARVEAISRLM